MRTLMQQTLSSLTLSKAGLVAHSRNKGVFVACCVARMCCVVASLLRAHATTYFFIYYIFIFICYKNYKPTRARAIIYRERGIVTGWHPVLIDKWKVGWKVG